MKTKFLIGLACVFLGALILWDLNVALGVLLLALGVSSLVDVITTKAGRKVQLTAIEGTFRVTAEGTNRREVEKEIDHALRHWQNNHT